MAEKTLGVRLVATGGGQVRAELTDIGKTGDAAFKQVEVSADSASRGLKKVGDAADIAGRSGGGMQNSLRQTTMQLSQVAQQGSATGNYLQALAIQLPDLALGFGPVGIAAGAVAGVLLTMAPSLMGAGGAAKEMQDKLDAADEAIQTLARSAKAAKTPMADLTQTYGESADEVERLNRANLAFDRAEAAKKLADAMKTLGLSQGAFARAMQGPQQPEMFEWLTEGRTATRQSEYEATLTRLSVQYRLTRDQAEALAKALEDVSEAAPGAAAVTAAANLHTTMMDVAGSAEKASEKFGGEGGLWEAARSVADLAKQDVEALKGSVRGMMSYLDEAISKIAQMKENLDSLPGGKNGILGQAVGWVNDFHETREREFGPATKSILDLIGWAEGTDKGRGYNETLGYGAFTGGPVNLVNMKIDEVLALQQRMLAHPGNTYNSSAVGRYQIVGKTLRSLKGQMGLTGEELFDEQMQDRLAMELVRARAQQGTQRGWYDEWQGLEAKNVSMATITDVMGLKSMGVDPSVTEARKKENDELKRALDLRADFISNMGSQVTAAAMEADAVGKSAYEQARLRAEMMLTQQAKAKGINLNEKMAGSEKTYGQAIKETAASIAASAQEQAAQEGRFKAAEDAAKKAADTMRKFQDDLKQGFTSAFQSVIDGTKSVSEAFRDMVAQMLAQRAAQQFSDGIGGLIGAVFGGGGGGDPLAAALSGAGVGGVRPAGGGFLGRIGSAVAQQAVHVTVGVDQRNGNIMAFTDQRVAAGMRQADRAMPSRVTSITRDPLKRG